MTTDGGLLQPQFLYLLHGDNKRGYSTEFLRDLNEEIHEDTAWHVGSKCSVCCVSLLFITIVVVIIIITTSLPSYPHIIITIITTIVTIITALSLSVQRELPGSRGLLVSGLCILFAICGSRLKSHWIRVLQSLYRP